MTLMQEMDEIALEALALKESDISPARYRHHESRLTEMLFEKLRGSIRKMKNHKNINRNHSEDADQHARMAIVSALNSWIPSISSFSTHVHWRLRAELRQLELTIYPERRRVSAGIDVRMIELNDITAGSDDYMTVLNLDPESEERTEFDADMAIYYTKIEQMLARIIYRRIGQYETGCLNRAAIKNCMRDVHIFKQRMIDSEVANNVGTKHHVSRERIRQINEKMKKEIKKQVESLEADPRPATAEETRRWNLAVAVYYEETESTEKGDTDLRLYKNGPILHSSNYEMKAPAEDLVTSLDDEADANLDEIVSATDANLFGDSFFTDEETGYGHNPQKIRPTRTKRARAAITAAATLSLAGMAVQPAAAQSKSRAIPPVSASDIASSVTNVKTASINLTNDIKPQAIKLENKKSWAVKLGTYSDKTMLRQAAADARTKHPEFRTLKIAYVPQRGETGVALAFGPLDQNAAEAICSQIEQDCKMVRLGER